MKYYVVIDTNVLISAVLKSTSIPGTLIREALEGRIVPLLNDEILAEYQEVLIRPQFRFDQRKIQILLEGMKKRGLYLSAEPVSERLPDPDDLVFYEVVMEARRNREAWLVTGNIRHFPNRYFIVTPREMLDILEKDAL